MNMLKTLIVSMAMLITLAANAVNITIYDGASSAATGWYGKQENQEVEPNTIAGQIWDMESFELVGNTLVMTGGYNFTSTVGSGGFRPGDIFFDVNGGGYDFVATVGTAGLTYDVYALPANTYSVFYSQNALSNPWRYKDGGVLSESALSVLYGNFADAEGTHYTASMDISWLLGNLVSGDSVVIHNTMECGNDNLMGSFAVPESGNSLAMLGLGGVAMLIIRRRK